MILKLSFGQRDTTPLNLRSLAYPEPQVTCLPCEERPATVALPSGLHNTEQMPIILLITTAAE